MPIHSYSNKLVVGLSARPIGAGIQRLWENRNLNVGGVVKAPSVWFDLYGADASAATARERISGTTLSPGGAGANPVVDDYSPGPFEPAAKGVGGKLLQASSIGDIGTGDIFLAVLTRMSNASAGVRMCISKRTNAAAPPLGEGWSMYQTAGGGGFGFHMLEVGHLYSGALVTSGITFDLETWYLYCVGVNRDESSVNCAQCYVWGAAASGGSDLSSEQGTLANGFDFGVLGVQGTSTYTLDDNGGVAWAAVWEQSNWFSAGAAGVAQMAVLAQYLTDVYSGAYALQHALGGGALG